MASRATVKKQERDSYHAWLSRNLPRGWSAEARHIKLIAETLDLLTQGVIDRLAIYLPPRHAKTETVTVRYAVYRLQRAEEAGESIHILVTGYADRFARRLSKKIRDCARLAGITLNSEKTATDEWETAGGSLVMARGVGSPPTGVGFDLIIIDDPVKSRKDAESKVFRDNLYSWYTDDLYTRLEPGGQILLIQTRWHEEDLGHFAPSQDPGRWREIVLPAICDREDDPLGRALGEALWPERVPLSELEDRKRNLTREEGMRSWESLYQQRPTPREGAFFVPTALVLGEPPREWLALVRGWDMAASTDGDWTVGVLIGLDKDKNPWVLDVARFRELPDRRDARIRATAEDDSATYGRGKVLHRLPQDPAAAGVVAAQALVRLLAGHRTKVERVSGDKQLRAGPFASAVNAKTVHVAAPEGKAPKWLPEFREELRTFDGGKNDDQVDAAADAYNELQTRRTIGGA